METRKEYIEKLASKLREWDARIDDLMARAEGAKADARLRYRQQILELRDLRERASVLLGELRESSDQTWQDVKKSVDHLLDDIRRALKKAA